MWCCLKIDASEIAHGGHSGYIETASDLLDGHYLFKGVDDLGHQPAGDTEIAGQESVVRCKYYERRKYFRRTPHSH